MRGKFSLIIELDRFSLAEPVVVDIVFVMEYFHVSSVIEREVDDVRIVGQQFFVVANRFKIA